MAPRHRRLNIEDIYADWCIKDIVFSPRRLCLRCRYKFDDYNKSRKRCPLCLYKLKKPNKTERKIMILLVRKMPFMSHAGVARRLKVKKQKVDDTAKRYLIDSILRDIIIQEPVIYCGFTRTGLSYIQLFGVLPFRESDSSFLSEDPPKGLYVRKG